MDSFKQNLDNKKSKKNTDVDESAPVKKIQTKRTKNAASGAKSSDVGGDEVLLSLEPDNVGSCR